MGAVDGIVLSHGHWDHGGAMLRALEMIQMNNGGREVATYMHPGMYRTRATRTPDGSMHLFDDVPSAAALKSTGHACSTPLKRSLSWRTSSSSAARSRESQSSRQDCRTTIGAPRMVRVGNRSPDR